MGLAHTTQYDQSMAVSNRTSVFHSAVKPNASVDGMFDVCVSECEIQDPPAHLAVYCTHSTLVRILHMTSHSTIKRYWEGVGACCHIL